MSVKSTMPIKCCCQCRKSTEVAPKQVTAQLLYRIAFTVWHVAFHIENEQVFANLTVY